jgi:hypothetical protein
MMARGMSMSSVDQSVLKELAEELCDKDVMMILLLEVGVLV